MAHRRLALPTASLGYFMVILDATVVNVAIPALRASFSTDLASVQWVVDAYTLMFAAFLLTGGALSDRFGAGRLFVTGAVLFSVASLACGAAATLSMLVVFRLIQGAGAALEVPASLALVQALHEDTGERAKAVGLWGAVAGVGAAAGPLVGGLLTSVTSWRAVFFLNVPIGVAIVGLARTSLPVVRTSNRRVDLPGLSLGILTLAGLTSALIEAGKGGWASSAVLAGFAVFVVAAVLLVVVEHRSEEPMLPLSLFDNRTFSAANVVGSLINLGFYGQLFVINLYVQEVWQYSALRAGVALLPELAMATIGSALSGRFTSRTGSPRLTMLVGLLLGAVGLFGLALAARGGYAELIPCLIAAGFGMAFTMPAATTAAVEGAPRDRAGLASGVLNAARQTGGAVGIALLGTLAGGANAKMGFEVAMVAAGTAFLSAVLVVLALDGGHIPPVAAAPYTSFVATPRHDVSKR